MRPILLLTLLTLLPQGVAPGVGLPLLLQMGGEAVLPLLQLLPGGSHAAHLLLLLQLLLHLPLLLLHLLLQLPLTLLLLLLPVEDLLQVLAVGRQHVDLCTGRQAAACQQMD